MVPEEIDAATEDLNQYRLEVVKERALEICKGLQDAGLPALVTLEIIDAEIPQASYLRMQQKWDIITAVKHFHDRRAKALRAGKTT